MKTTDIILNASESLLAIAKECARKLNEHPEIDREDWNGGFAIFASSFGTTPRILIPTGHSKEDPEEITYEYREIDRVMVRGNKMKVAVGLLEISEDFLPVEDLFTVAKALENEYEILYNN